MAITKLMHMKASNGKNPSAHLQNSIEYILNDKKTKDGALVFSNCGLDSKQMYESMMDTKQLYGKNWGRQGYHFALSFPPGEVDAEQAMELTTEFCEQYFQNEYDYVLAAHDDQEHKHGHIIFNSVSREGRKYRYEKGDWEKYIQPITNELCQKHGLSYVQFDEETTRAKQKDHKKWETERGNKSWSNLIRQNIDDAIDMSSNYEEFLSLLQHNGYQVHEGMSEKYGAYLSLKAYGADKARRNYGLGVGYSLKEIKDRIENKELSESIRQKIEDMDPYQQVLLKMNFQVIQKMPIPVFYYNKSSFLCNWNNKSYYPYQKVQYWKFRSELRELEHHMDRLTFTVQNNIQTTDDLFSKKESLKKEITYLVYERKKTNNQLDTTGTINEVQQTQLNKLNATLKAKRKELRMVDQIAATYQVKEQIPTMTKDR